MLHVWYAALAAKHGVAITSSCLERTKHQLYAARKKAADPDLGALSIETSPLNPDELWIMKNGKETENGKPSEGNS
jgi:hypothetical protein